MKRLVLMILLLTVFSSSFALDIDGDILVDLRMGLTNQEFLFNQETLSLKFEHSDGGDLSGVFQLDFLYKNGLLNSSGELSHLMPQDIGTFYNQYPLEISINEAYFTYSGFLIPGLDLTVGKQRIAWGSAVLFNPTDILNPADLSDPFDFNKKIASLALNAQYYLPFAGSSLQLIYQPYSQVARLDPIFFNQLENMLNEQLSSNFTGLNYIDAAGNWSDSTVNIPEWVMTNGLYAAKYAFTLGGMDLGLNFVSRLNDLPVVRQIDGLLAMDVSVDVSVHQETDLINDGGITTNTFTNGLTMSNNTNATMMSHSYELGYGRELEAGLDFSKDVGGFLIWGEVGVYLPNQLDSSVDMISDASAVMSVVVTNAVYADSDPGVATNLVFQTNILVTIITTNNFQMTNTESKVGVSNEISVKYVLGIDRSFNKGWYGNFQYIHGLSREQGSWGPNRLQDYFMLVIRKSVLSDKLVFNLGSIFSINTLKDAIDAPDFMEYTENNYGASLQFSAAYSPVPDIKVEIGTFLLDGKNSTLALMKDYDMIFTKFSYSF